MDDKNQRTLYCGNLSDKVTEDILYELFLQAGPLENVTIPKAPDGRKKPFAFITFRHEVSVPYTIALMNGLSLYGKLIRLELRTGSTMDNPYIEALDKHQRSVSCPTGISYGNNFRIDMKSDYTTQRFENGRNGFDHRGLPNRYQERCKTDYSDDHRFPQRFTNEFRIGYGTNFQQQSFDLYRLQQSQKHMNHASNMHNSRDFSHRHHSHFLPYGRNQ